jgi:hypothetical protein
MRSPLATLVSQESENNETVFSSYEIPIVEQESTMTGPLPVAVENEDVTFTIIDSSTKRGNATVIDSMGFSYTIKRKTSVATTWRCAIRNKKINCKATVRETVGQFIEGNIPHNHPPTSGLEPARKVAAELNRLASEKTI